MGETDHVFLCYSFQESRMITPEYQDKKIIVHAPDKSSGKRKQEIEIIFNFVGQVDIPVLTESIILERVPKGKKTA